MVLLLLYICGISNRLLIHLFLLTDRVTYAVSVVFVGMLSLDSRHQNRVSDEKAFNSMITLTHVSKWFKTAHGTVTAVEDVDLYVETGQIFGIIGYSGAGKSTLIRLLNGLEQPSSGHIEVAGHALSSISSHELKSARRKISMVFQHFNLLWSRTVADNIAFPLEIAGVPRAERQRRVDELITLVGLEGRAHTYPAQLSGGQKQRVGIARALANNPDVLLCDEATSALDPQTTDDILALLSDINRRLGLTIVLITHEMHVVRQICHRVAVMEKGRIVEQGAVLDVFTHPQQPITQKFVRQLSGPQDSTAQIAARLKQQSLPGRLVKLTFIGVQTEKPLIAELIQRYQLMISILHGSINYTSEGVFGLLFLHVQGDDARFSEMSAFVASQQVEMELIDD